MRNKIFTIVILLSGLLSVKAGIAQDFTALYSYTYNTHQKKQDKQPNMNGMKTYYRLITKGDQSLYYITINDTSKYNREGAYHSDVVYTFLKDQRILKVDKSLIKNSARSYKFLDFKKLNIKNKNIMYRGHKSILVSGIVNDEEVNIYFIPDIPTPFGPSIYSGLPGLVVKVETPKAIIQLISFEQMKIENYPYIDTTQLTLMDEKTYNDKKMKKVFEIIKKRKARQH